MEHEICRRETKRKSNWCNIAIIISLIYAVIAFIPNLVIGISYNELFQPEFYMGLYWIGYGNMILGLVLAIFFAVLKILFTRACAIVLTDKRIYCLMSRRKLFLGMVEITRSYNLSQIVSYDFLRYRKWYVGELLLKTASSSIALPLDMEFYNKFVCIWIDIRFF